MSIEIQILELSRLVEAMKLVEHVFMEFEAPDYSKEGVDFFLEYIRVDAMKERIEKGEIAVWCSLVDNTIVGVIAMRPPCAVSLLFVDRHHHRKGISKEMLTCALKVYRKDHCDVTVNSSPYAVAAYCKMGFKQIGSEEINHGVRFQPMVLR